MFNRLIAILLLLVCAAGTASAAPPNIVYMLADDAGWGNFRAFAPGSPIRTPNIDRLAAEGVKFTNFYAAPVCSPSRYRGLTGRYEKRDGWGAALGPDSTDGLNATNTTIPEVLRPAGYKSAIFGKWHLGMLPRYNPTRHGFDQFFGLPMGNSLNSPVPIRFTSGETILPKTYTVAQLTPTITAKAIEFINANKARPFFLYLAYTDPHLPLWSNYRAVVEGVDKSVGQVLAAIRSAGLDRSTLVIFTSDNGPVASVPPLREGKNTWYEGGVRAPFIARWTGRIGAGRTVNAPAANIDLLPTFARVAGVPLPATRIDGKDIGPLMFGTGSRAAGPNEFMIYNMNLLRACRIGPWKLHFTKTGSVGNLYNLATDISEAHPVNDAARKQTQAARCRQIDAGILREHPIKRGPAGG